MASAARRRGGDVPGHEEGKFRVGIGQLVSVEGGGGGETRVQDVNAVESVEM